MDSAETKTIRVVLNGQPKSVPAGRNIEELLAWLEMDSSRVAVELDRAIVRKPAWAGTEVLDGAQIEIVWFVGGG